MRELHVRTPTRQCWVDITEQVSKSVAAETKAVLVFSPHTTAGILINENADPDVQSDFFAKLGHLVPKQEAYYRHDEGNSDAHLLTALVGTHVYVPVENGRLALGRWQAIYFCEFDGPRERRALVQVLP